MSDKPPQIPQGRARGRARAVPLTQEQMDAIRMPGQFPPPGMYSAPQSQGRGRGSTPDGQGRGRGGTPEPQGRGRAATPEGRGRGVTPDKSSGPA